MADTKSRIGNLSPEAMQRNRVKGGIARARRSALSERIKQMMLEAHEAFRADPEDEQGHGHQQGGVDVLVALIGYPNIEKDGEIWLHSEARYAKNLRKMENYEPYWGEEEVVTVPAYPETDEGLDNYDPKNPETEEVLLEDLAAENIEKYRLRHLLAMLPGVGKASIENMLEESGIDFEKKMSGLTMNQYDAVLEHLNYVDPDLEAYEDEDWDDEADEDSEGADEAEEMDEEVEGYDESEDDLPEDEGADEEPEDSDDDTAEVEGEETEDEGDDEEDESDEENEEDLPEGDDEDEE